MKDQRIFEDMIRAMVQMNTLKEMLIMFKPDVKHIVKKAAGNLDQHLSTALNIMKLPVKQQMDGERLETYIDDTSAMYMEVLYQLDKAKDKREFLAMLRMYNEGLVRVEE